VYGEYTIYQIGMIFLGIRIKSQGPAGHGSRFIDNTATEKLTRVINKLLAFRKSEFERLQKGVRAKQKLFGGKIFSFPDA
jgi:hypothetical protein